MKHTEELGEDAFYFEIGKAEIVSRIYRFGKTIEIFLANKNHNS